MTSTGYEATPGSWHWADDAPGKPEPKPQPTTDSSDYIPNPHAPSSGPSQPQPSQAHQQQRHQRYYKPRTCRICLETVLPTFHAPSEDVPGFMAGNPYVSYDSPDLGRLIRPCKCKGTSKYVHEGCLSAWRHADPAYSRRNFWQCPTCGYRYRLQRLGVGRVVSSVAAQIILTVAIVLGVIFVLGFVADPIIAFCLDPVGSLSILAWNMGWSTPPRGYYYADLYEQDDEPGTWSEHMIRGFASLGLLSFFKVIFTSPWQLFYRNTWGSRHAGTTGRDRLSNTTWVLVLIGAVTFLYVGKVVRLAVIMVAAWIKQDEFATNFQQTVWKGVRGWSRRTLEKAGERVMDVHGDDDNDDEDDGGTT